MFSKIVLTIVMLVGVAAQDAVQVRVVGFAESENVVNLNTAVATAIANIQSACKKGEELSAAAQAEAEKLVTAAATAVAGGGIFIQSAGRGSGAGSVSAKAESTATAIAKAIAEAIASVAGGPEVAAKTEAITQASESVKVAIEQAALVQGTGNVVAAAAASATVFVSAVAQALAAAAGRCDPATGEGTVAAQVGAATQELPSFADFTSTQTVAAANIFGDGIAAVLANSAVAQTDGNTFPSTVPAPASQVKPADDLVQNILCSLGVATTGC